MNSFGKVMPLGFLAAMSSNNVGWRCVVSIFENFRTASRHTCAVHFLWSAAVLGTTTEWFMVSKLSRPARRRPGITSRVSLCKLSNYSNFLTNAVSRVIYEINDIKILTDGLWQWLAWICEAVIFFRKLMPQGLLAVVSSTIVG